MAAAHLLDQGQREEAESFYAIAIVLSAMHGWRPGAAVDPEAAAHALLLPIMVMFEHLLMRGQDHTAFAAEVWDVLDREYQGFGRRFKFALEVALDTYSSEVERSPSTS